MGKKQKVGEQDKKTKDETRLWSKMSPPNFATKASVILKFKKESIAESNRVRTRNI